MHKHFLTIGALASLSALYLAPKVNAQDVSGVNPDVSYSFQTVDYPSDTFTQLLGINNKNLIAGYHGVGSTTHPNKGFTLTLPDTFTAENFPGSVQTQVIGIDDNGVTDGFYIDTKMINHGFVDNKGTFFQRDYPGTTFNQLLGVNNLFQVVGFYNDSKNISHAVVWDGDGGLYLVFEDGHAPGGMQAGGINNLGDIAGFYVDSNAVNHAFLLKNGVLTTLNYPEASSTQAFGINDKDEIVGTYTDSGGLIHGFTYQGGSWQTVDDPSGIGASFVNGVNNAGWLVGFYGNCTSGGSICHGFVATPKS